MQPLNISNCIFEDGGQEVIAARFLHPDDALAEFRESKIALMPPQYYILYTLSPILRGHENTEEQRARVEQLARGMFGRMVITPRRLGEPDEQGRVILTYPGDHTRGGPKGRLHRGVLKFGTRGVRWTTTRRLVGLTNVSLS